MWRVAPSERLEQAFSDEVLASGDALGEAARRGAQLLLQKALEAEIDAFRYLSRKLCLVWSVVNDT